MFNKTKFDISHENFDIYFANHLPSITPEAKEKLPQDVVYSLYRGDVPTARNVSKLSFIAKLWILWKCFRKNIYIIVKDENGSSLKQFLEYDEVITKKRISQEDIEGDVAELHFITANKELCDTLDYLNKQCVSPLYNYLHKGKNNIENPVSAWKDQMNFIVEHFNSYESTKKKWSLETGVKMAEWYVLMYCYHGNPVVGADIYNKTYKRAFGSSISKIKLAFSTLQQRGYLVKIGEKKGATMQITSLGKEFVNTIITKYILNC